MEDGLILTFPDSLCRHMPFCKRLLPSQVYIKLIITPDNIRYMDTHSSRILPPPTLASPGSPSPSSQRLYLQTSPRRLPHYITPLLVISWTRDHTWDIDPLPPTTICKVPPPSPSTPTGNAHSRSPVTNPIVHNCAPLCLPSSLTHIRIYPLTSTWRFSQTATPAFPLSLLE